MTADFVQDLYMTRTAMFLTLTLLGVVCRKGFKGEDDMVVVCVLALATTLFIDTTFGFIWGVG